MKAVMKSVALISLPGARLEELARRVAPDLQLTPVAAEALLGGEALADRESLVETDNNLIVLPSDFLEKGGADAIRSFRERGGLVVFVDLSWEESWKAVANDGAPNAEGLPWRTVYRKMARQRAAGIRETADLEVSGSGSLEDIAARLVQAIFDFGTDQDF